MVFASLAIPCAFLATWTGHAQAHNTFVGSSPADGESLAAAPETWTVTFASPVPLDSASGEVVRADGTRTALPAPTQGEDTSTVVFALPTDLSGAVTARWRLVGTDGHVISGRVNFSIGATADGAGLAPPDVDEPARSGLPAPVRHLLRTLNYFALLVVGGLVLVDTRIVRGAMDIPVASRALPWAAWTLPVVPALQTIQLAADIEASSFFGAFSGLGRALDTIPGQMSTTRVVFGTALALAVLASPDIRQRKETTGITAVAAAGYLVTLAYAGHSRSEGAAWLGIPVDVAHTAAVVYWLGGLAVILLVVAPAVSTTAAIEGYRRFGKGAQIAVPVIVATGVVQTARLHGGVTTLFTTGHGRLLLVKVAIVAVMLRVADRNRRLLSVARDQMPPARLRRQLTATALSEVAIGLVVIAVTAVLVTSSLS